MVYKGGGGRNSRAQCMVGLCYEMGQGVAEDIQKATEYYRQAAENGNVTAMCNLGYCYYTGIGVEEDDDEAVKWFQKAADRGQPRALFLLGECYEEGHGVQADEAMARSLYRQAANLGFRGAKDALRRLDGLGAYTYVPPESAAPEPQPPKAKEKPKKGGLFGFFKK